MKMKLFDLAVILALFAGVAFSVADFESTCADIRGDVLRLHVIADSDTAEAQRVKLKVRDAVLLERGELFKDTDSLTAARDITEKSLSEIEAIAAATLKAEGSPLPVSARVESCYFPTRVYGDITLPAGYYEALRIVIGSGQGQNWWCVMFPPMCLSAAEEQYDVMSTALDEKEMKLITSKPKYEVRFWLVEKYWELVGGR